MERAVIQSDLKKHNIQPENLLSNYHSLLKEDIKNLLPENVLKASNCPVSNEKDIRENFIRLGMKYKMSLSLGNIYLSPRPSADNLKLFYQQSKARSYWLTELWPETKTIRSKKIILPQLEWVKGFMAQFGSPRTLNIGEYLPNHWGYASQVKHIIPVEKYHLVDPLFNPYFVKDLKSLHIVEKVLEGSLDSALLFEALDRTVNPRELLERVKNSLKPGGLCFITCLLASRSVSAWPAVMMPAAT